MFFSKSSQSLFKYDIDLSLYPLSHISRPGCFSMNLIYDIFRLCLKAEIYRSDIKFKNAS